MRAIRNLFSARGDRGQVAMNRRTTFLFAVGGVAGLASQSRAAIAESHPKTSQLQNLKALEAGRRVVAIHHRRDTFEVLTADGRTAVFSAVDLRFKIDSGDNGPPAGRPVILPGGMMGDRATVFFASAAEIGQLIEHRS